MPPESIPEARPLPPPDHPGGGLLTAAAVVTLVTAGLDFMASGFFVAAWAFFNILNLPLLFYNTIGGQPDAKTGLSVAAERSLFLAAVVLAKTVPKVVCGVGLLRRRSWAVYLGLALALVAAILTVVGLVLGAFSVALWIGAYSAFMFYALAPYWRRGLDSAAPGSGTRALGTPAAPEPDRGQS